MMKSFEIRNEIEDLANECAAAVLEAVPILMRTIRAEIRQKFVADLSLPQFRALVFLQHDDRHASLNDMADFLGLCPSSTSKLIDNLVVRGLIRREACPSDRRRVMLSLTAHGHEIFERVCARIRTLLAGRLATLPAEDITRISIAMQRLCTVFI